LALLDELRIGCVAGDLDELDLALDADELVSVLDAAAFVAPRGDDRLLVRVRG
jgi:hypothetical protein